MNVRQLIADRIGGSNFGQSEEYKFAKIKRWKFEASRTLGDKFPLIDLGVGEPDKPADTSICDVLALEAKKSKNRYYADNGINEFQNAAADFMKKIFNVEGLSPTENIIHGIGSKSILAMLPMCFINPGDYALVTVPGYPVLATYTKYLGGKVYPLKLRAENDFFPDYSEISSDILEKAKVLYINYPNNPTGKVATIDFFKKTINFAKRNNIIVINDAAYSNLVYNNKPLSILSIEGAMDVAVEIHSLSKSFNMTGWRMGFIVGNEDIVSAYGHVKDNTDSGQFRAIQLAATYALSNSRLIENNCQKYYRRLKLLVEVLKSVGFSANVSEGTFYCYVKAPVGTKDGIRFNSALDVSEFLIKKYNISVVPWDDCGNYLRFSVTYDNDDEILVMNELKKRLLKANFDFK